MTHPIRAGLLALCLGSGASAAPLDLADFDLQLDGGPIAQSTSMSIANQAPIDLGGFVLPGFFQALNAASVPALELNTSDGNTYNLALTPGSTLSTTTTARVGDSQLELLFGETYFARFTLDDGDSLDSILMAATFGDATLTVWELTPLAAPTIPVPASLPMLAFGLAAFGALRRRRASVA